MSLLFTKKFPRTKTSVMNIHSYYPRIYQVITVYQVIIKSALSALIGNWKGNLSGTRKGKLILSSLSWSWNCSVQFCHSVVSDCLRPYEPQHAWPPCSSPIPGVYSNSCPLSQWCHPTISSSVVPFSSCLQSFPGLRSFQMSQLFASGGQKYWDFSFNISPSNEHSGLISFRMDWLDLLAVQGTLKSLLQHNSSKASVLQHSVFMI